MKSLRMKCFFYMLLCCSLLYANENRRELDFKDITNYKVLHQSVMMNNSAYTLIRSFMSNGTAYYLMVNEESLKTTIVPAWSMTINNKHINNSRYKMLLEKYSQSPYRLQNYGVTHLNSQKTYLTTDLCPSLKKGYEQKFFKNLIQNYAINKPVPLTIFVSGEWIKKHEKSFLELIQFSKENKLDITWANHTFHHHYKEKKSLTKNFLLLPHTNVIDEVLELEKLLLSYKITPSILFRFPGLISNQDTVETIKYLGLIPIGSDAWLAKEQSIQKGSIILVHGNKNEPYGIKKASDLLFKKKHYLLSSILKDIQ